MPDEHEPLLLEVSVAVVVYGHDRIAPGECVTHGCSGTCKGDVFQLLHGLTRL